MSQGASPRCPAPRTSIMCVAESSTASSAAMPARNGSAPGRVRTASSSPRTAAPLDQEGGAGGGFGGLAGRRLRLERPVAPSLRTGFEQNVDVVDRDVADPQGTGPERNDIDGNLDPARPNHERLGPPGSVRERDVGGREGRGEGDRQVEGAGDLQLAPDGLAGDSLDGSAQPSGHDRSRRRSQGDHPAVSTIAIRKRLRCLVMRRAAPSHHAIVAAEPVPASHQGAGDAGKLSDGTRPRLMAWTSSARLLGGLRTPPSAIARADHLLKTSSAAAAQPAAA